ncbi:MAG: nuclear transport factor 2 family protein, partial [Desulfobacteraceae bacterium]
MDKEQIETLVQSYVKSYNRFDIAGMLKSIHPEICFKNISGDAVTASANGVHAFEALAEKAAAVFQERSQTIRSIDIQGRTARVGIDYRGIL